MVRLTLTVSLLLGVTAPALAQTDLGAELKLTQQVLISREGDRFRDVAHVLPVTTANLRLKAEGASGSWSWSLNDVWEGNYSSRFADLSALRPPPPSEGLAGFQNVLADGPNGDVTHRVDRLWVAFSSPKAVVRLGRQALTWGHGQVFHPLDLFAPFAPDAQDTSYKPGADMVYAQYVFSGGGDVQAILVPRRRAGGSLAAGRSSFAVKSYWMWRNVETEVVAAVDYGDRVLAFGAAGPWDDALWKFDIVTTVKDEGGAGLSAVVSLHDGWVWGERPLTGFIEYYRNAFGITDRRPASDMPAALSERIARGQIFTTSRDYVAVGGTLQLTPLMQIAPTVLGNLRDSSALLILYSDFSLADDADVVGGMQLPLGRRGTEFGGRAVVPGSSRYEAPPRDLFVRLEWYL